MGTNFCSKVSIPGLMPSEAPAPGSVESSLSHGWDPSLWLSHLHGAGHSWLCPPSSQRRAFSICHCLYQTAAKRHQRPCQSHSSRSVPSLCTSGQLAVVTRVSTILSSPGSKASQKCEVRCNCLTSFTYCFLVFWAHSGLFQSKMGSFSQGPSYLRDAFS